MHGVILRTVAAWMVPVTLVAAFLLLLRGHHLPGGGFAGGLVAAAGLVAYGLTHGRDALRRVLGLDPVLLVGGGLLIALVSGVISLFLMEPFLTGQWTVIPLGEGIKVGTPLLFDIGVAAVVIGAVLLVLDGFLETESST